MRQRQESRFDDVAIQSLQPFLTHFFGELAFPHHDHFPAHRFKFGMLSDISFVVAQQFRTPKFHIRFRHARGFRAVLCICQKQPLMNTIVRYFGNTTSGCPGYRLSFLRNRRPFEKRKLRTIISMDVSLPRICDMM